MAEHRQEITSIVGATPLRAMICIKAEKQIVRVQRSTHRLVSN
jgi:hypothetical protein